MSTCSLAFGSVVGAAGQGSLFAAAQPAPASTLVAAAAAPTLAHVPDANSSSSRLMEESSLTLESAPVSGAELPEAPGVPPAAAGTPGEPGAQGSSQATPTVAPRLTKYIPSGWTAQTLTPHDKVLLGLRDLYSPLNFIAMVASAGYEQALNGEPNYGTDRGAFGERLGAAAIRESTQGLFTDSIFSPLLHEDPRYYVQGPSHGFFYRTGYAVTRTLVTKTDSGKSSVNGALLMGYAASAALSYTYYPTINKDFHDTAATFGGSLGGAALGFFVSEFSDDVLKAVHLRKK
jgi:hypothetical protein